MKRILLGLAVAFLLWSGMATAGTPTATPAAGGFCPVTSDGLTGPLAPVLSAGCAVTVNCPGGSHVSCTGPFVGDCSPLVTCSTSTPCGVSCSPSTTKYCPGYNASTCAC